jgi:hypothetical protein
MLVCRGFPGSPVSPAPRPSAPRTKPRLHQHPRRVVDLFYSAIIAAFTRNGHRPRRGLDGIWPVAAIVPRVTLTRRSKTGESAASSGDPVIRQPGHPERSEGSRFARDALLKLSETRWLSTVSLSESVACPRFFRLSDASTSWCSPAPWWSANGQKIFFMSFRPSTGGQNEVVVMDINGQMFAS